MTLPIAFRKATTEDLTMVKDSWRKSFRDSDFAKTLTTAFYNQVQNGKMQMALENGETTMAYLNSDPDCLFGYVVHTTNERGLTVIQYLYVKHVYRKQGIAKALLSQIKPSVPVIFTDITPKFYQLRDLRNLPYVTPAEFEGFEIKNPSQPLKPFAKWLHDRFYQLQRKAQ